LLIRPTVAGMILNPPLHPLDNTNTASPPTQLPPLTQPHPPRPPHSPNQTLRPPPLNYLPLLASGPFRYVPKNAIVLLYFSLVAKTFIFFPRFPLETHSGYAGGRSELQPEVSLLPFRHPLLFTNYLLSSGVASPLRSQVRDLFSTSRTGGDPPSGGCTLLAVACLCFVFEPTTTLPSRSFLSREGLGAPFSSHGLVEAPSHATGTRPCNGVLLFSDFYGPLSCLFSFVVWQFFRFEGQCGSKQLRALDDFFCLF